MHILSIIGFIAAGIGLLLLGTWTVKSLWNWLAPTLRLPQIQFKHALGILVLSRILLGGFGGHHGGPHAFAYRSNAADCMEQRNHWHQSPPNAAPLPGADSTATQ